MTVKLTLQSLATAAETAFDGLLRGCEGFRDFTDALFRFVLEPEEATVFFTERGEGSGEALVAGRRRRGGLRLVPEAIKKSTETGSAAPVIGDRRAGQHGQPRPQHLFVGERSDCLLYTSDAADDLLCVDPGGRRIIKKKK